MVVNDNGVETDWTDYYPFGLEMPGRVSTGGTGAMENYTGHELDAGTGLHYANARFYDSILGRWGSRDPSEELFPSYSTYNYVFNNPLVWTDPTGEDPCDKDHPEFTQECPNVVLPEVIVEAERPERASTKIASTLLLVGAVGYGNDVTVVGIVDDIPTTGILLVGAIIYLGALGIEQYEESILLSRSFNKPADTGVMDEALERVRRNGKSLETNLREMAEAAKKLKTKEGRTLARKIKGTLKQVTRNKRPGSKKKK